MSTKRKSRGRSKGGKGKGGLVQCNKCGQQVPRDKAKKVSRRVSLVDSRMYKELRKAGTYMPTQTVMKYYCVSCAVHSHVVNIRSRDERRKPFKKKRFRT